MSLSCSNEVYHADLHRLSGLLGASEHPDSSVGKKVKCPTVDCGEVIKVPALTADEDEDRPRRRARADIEVDEEQPRRQRGRVDVDDEEEERPRRRRGRDEDDDEEEERPRKKKRPVDEEDRDEERPRRRSRRDDDVEEEREPRPGRCPKCGSKRWSKVGFTWWGGLVGPAIFSMVRCNKCSTSFNRKRGTEIGATHILLYSLGGLVIGGAIVAVLTLGAVLGK